MMDWAKYFYYDEISPSCLSNKIDRPPKALKNTFAGYQRKDGYWLVGHQGKNVLVHRIIYEIFHGFLKDDYQVDHIDGDSSNNKIENLRAVERQFNQRNMKLDSRNKSGKAGVTRTEVKSRGNTFPYWNASWSDLQGNKKRKSFSVVKLGESTAYKLACCEREKQIKMLNQVGAGYTERNVNDQK